ncbi:hypothetical protein BD779DRAFT_1505326 [Infundibulicybe gibba]|nr:hypothetical protein BD779DRAFT_1505326 [Infundibulicybe gibba]
MLTTRSTDGHLHSRAMTPVDARSETELTLTFLANNTSHKFEEIANDSNINVSFYDTETTRWASYSGKAKITRDKKLIEEYWSSKISSYFGDLKDGIHKGDRDDPRISIIQVIPDEIRYWFPTKGALGRAIDSGVGVITGRSSAPGQLRTITKSEIQLTQGLHTK